MKRTLLALLRLIEGRDGDRALRPIALVALLYALAFATFWSFVAVWAVDDVGARASSVGVMFVFSSLAAVLGGYLSGRVSDSIGRRSVIVFALVAQAAVVFALVFVDDALLGLGLVVLAGACSAPALTGTNAIVADVVTPARQEAAYATVRVAQNLGLVLGPPVAALLLFIDDWDAFLVGVAGVGLFGGAVAARLLPSVGAQPKESLPPRALLVIARDVPFVLLLLSTFLGFVVYVPFEVVLPIVAVESFGLAPATWGLLLIINPILVTLFQLRLTSLVGPYPPALRLAVGLALMGFPLLLLLASGAVWVLVCVLVLFVVGEMLWIPTSQALAARLAPAHLRGAYIGVFGASAAVAWTVAPFVALQLRAASGDGAMWLFFVGVAVAGTVAGVAATRVARGSAAETTSLANDTAFVAAPASAPSDTKLTGRP